MAQELQHPRSLSWSLPDYTFNRGAAITPQAICWESAMEQCLTLYTGPKTGDTV